MLNNVIFAVHRFEIYVLCNIQEGVMLAVDRKFNIFPTNFSTEKSVLTFQLFMLFMLCCIFFDVFQLDTSRR